MRKDGIQTRKRKPKKNGSGNGAVELGLSKKDDKEGRFLCVCILYGIDELWKMKKKTGFSHRYRGKLWQFDWLAFVCFYFTAFYCFFFFCDHPSTHNFNVSYSHEI